MKALIIDDERLAREELRRLLKAHPEIEISGEAKNSEEAKNLIESDKPHVIFLDIQMPGENGFELLENIDHVPEVIFTTAYDQFAIQAFEVNALDYLLKPIDPSRLATAIQKLKLAMILDKPPAQSEPKLLESDQVFVREGEKCWFVKLQSIRLMESEGNYTRLHFDGNKPLILRSLTQLEERLDPKIFFRADRQNIINIQWIEKIDPWFDNGLKVVLKGGLEVKMSRRQAQKFK